jgi:hypothetical protein
MFSSGAPRHFGRCHHVEAVKCFGIVVQLDGHPGLEQALRLVNTLVSQRIHFGSSSHRIGIIKARQHAHGFPELRLHCSSHKVHRQVSAGERTRMRREDWRSLGDFLA